MSLEQPWVKIARPRPDARTRLLCIPHAGGGATAFRTWADGLPADVEVCAVQLPGRENRLMEEALRDVPAAVKALADVLGPSLVEPWALFGHSMGALIGFELLRELRRRGVRAPRHFFASGYRAPHVPDPHPPIYDLPDNEFVEEMNRRYDAVPPAARESAELMELFLPGLRADISVCDTYAYSEDDPLDCPISACGGEQDEQVARADLEAWAVQTSASFDLSLFPGGHFFIESARDEVLASISTTLSEATG